MTNKHYLTNHLLIAMPGLGDGRFERSVTLICEHTKEGALGIVINSPIDMTYADLFTHLGHINKDTQPFTLASPILWGGPCERERGFVVHRSVGHWKNTFMVSEDVALTVSQDILLSIAKQEGPNDALIAFGCARWQAGQLEDEIADNAWLTAPATDAILFDCPYEERWSTAAALMGVDFKRMSYEVGHA